VRSKIELKNSQSYPIFKCFEQKK